MYGPVAFLWITLGGILIGGLHDYVSGMISMKMGGLSPVSYTHLCSPVKSPTNWRTAVRASNADNPIE